MNGAVAHLRSALVAIAASAAVAVAQPLIPAQAVPAQASPAQAAAEPPASAPATASGTQLAPRPGDVIRLRVWREPDMSGDYQVNESGDVTLPRVAALHVTGISADSLRRYLIATYSPYLRDATVDVFVLRRVRVVGAVRNPGLYPVDATMTLGDVIALAGGATPDGDHRTVRLVRGGTAQTVTLARGTRITESPIQSGDQIEVPERGWVARNPGILAGLVSTAGFLAATLIRK